MGVEEVRTVQAPVQAPRVRPAKVQPASATIPTPQVGAAGARQVPAPWIDHNHARHTVMCTAGKTGTIHVFKFLSKCISKGASDLKLSPDAGNTMHMHCSGVISAHSAT